MKILLLEDDLSLRELIKDELTNSGFVVYSFRDGNSAMDSLYNTTYDLMLLDINVPELDGYEFLKMLRDMNNQTPVIIISSYSDIDHLSKGYEFGCNDYLKKPFSLKELELRIKELLKNRILNTTTNYIELEYGYSYDLNNQKLLYKNEVVRLVKKEILFIEILIQNRDNIVPIERILDYVWDNQTSMNNLRVLIYKLRKKIDQNLIKNYKGLGYRI